MVVNVVLILRKKSLCVLALTAFLQSSQWMFITVKFSFSNSLRLNFVVPFSTSCPLLCRKWLGPLNSIATFLFGASLGRAGRRTL